MNPHEKSQPGQSQPGQSAPGQPVPGNLQPEAQVPGSSSAEPSAIPNGQDSTRADSTRADVRMVIDCLSPRGSHTGAQWHTPEIAAVVNRIAHDPELSRLRDKIQSIDTAIVAALDHLPVPEGLADRLLARLRLEDADQIEAAPRESAPLAAVSPEPESLEQVSLGQVSLERGSLIPDSLIPAAHCPIEPAGRTCQGDVDHPGRRPRRPWFTRRRRIWLTSVTSALLVVAAVFAAMHLRKSDGPIPTDVAMDRALDWFEQDRGEEWKVLDAGASPGQFPLYRSIQRKGEIRWRPVDRFLDRSGVAYRLTGPGGVRAVLFVLWLKQSGAPSLAGNVPSSPTMSPTDTRGCTTAMWKQGKHLYVFVVAGKPDDYRRFFRQPGMA